MCEVCTASGCLRCAQGFAFNGSACLPCLLFDPRCVECSSQGCSLCADAVLRSARRSGFRAGDTIPFDDIEREFSISLPFGTQNPEAFAEAETYQLQTSVPSLREVAVSCAQGLYFNATWSCSPTPISHVVCGHAGVFAFTYPNYVVAETIGFLRLSVRRSGGGAFPASVRYSLIHINTTNSDVSATAPYTSSQTLLFDTGIIEMSFLVTIFDNPFAETSRVFQIVLEPPSAGSLGPQCRTNVTIIEGNNTLDANQVNSFISTIPSSSTPTNSSNGLVASVIAGSEFSAVVGITARNGGNTSITIPSVLALIVMMEGEAASDVASQSYSSSHALLVSEINPGSFNVSGELYQQGMYYLYAWYARVGGILGSYYYDAFFQDFMYTRIDRAIDFNWDSGIDAKSIRWSGCLSVKDSGTYFFGVATNESVRLVISGQVLLDHFAGRGAGLERPRQILLLNDTLYSLVVEFRASASTPSMSLLWGRSAEELGILPFEQLYSLNEVENSPYPLQVVPSTISAGSTECFGEGLFSGTAGEASTFSCCPRDAFGNTLQYDCCDDYQEILTAIAAVVYSPNINSGAPESVDASTVFNTGSGCFDGTYTPIMAGYYQLNITVQKGDSGEMIGVAGSPFAPIISPARTSYFYSIVSGLSPPLVIFEGSCLNFSIVAKDVWNNFKLQGGDLWTVRIATVRHRISD